MAYTRLQQLSPFPHAAYGPPPHATALAFDPYADLLHLGSSTGSVSSLAHPAALARYVVYPAHGALGSGPFGTQGMGLGMGAGPVHAIRAVDKEVRVLTEGGVGARLRNGQARWTIDDPSHGLRTFCSNPLNSHELIAGGVGGQLMVINAARGQVVKSLEQPHALCQLDSTRSTVFAASPTGHIQLLDTRQGMRVTNSLSSASTFAGGLSGFDLHDQVVLAWGWTVAQGQLVQDPTLKLFDIRTLRSSGTVAFEAGPAHAKLDRGQAGRAVVCSSEGYVEVLDLWTGQRHAGFQLECSSPISTMALSERGTYAAFAEYDGPLHIYTAQDLSDPALLGRDGLPELEPFNGHRGAIEVEWPSMPEVPPAIAWTEQTPLNVIGMPAYTEKLASNLFPQVYLTQSSPLVQPPPKIPREVLATVRMVDGIGYAPLPRDLRGRRNVVCARADANLMPALKDAAGLGAGMRGMGDAKARRESGPRFRSERERHQRAATDELATAAENGINAAHMPKYYRKVEIKYSRFGVEDFDFEYYNHTRFSGLETHITNSYTNSVLQALHYLLPIRRYAKSHIRRECNKEHCMLCESGFLFRMLEDAQGTNCQASNFSRAFSSTAQAHSLGLFMRDEEETAPDVAGMIQKFARWLLATYSEEARLVTGPSSAPPEAVMTGFVSRKVDTCSSCGKKAARDAIVHAIDLQYPRKAPGQDAAVNHFTSVLEASLRRDNISKATCSFCKRVVLLQSNRIFPPGSSLPPILSINASVIQDEHREFWRDRPGTRPASQRRFLPTAIRLQRLQDGGLRVHPSLSEGATLEGVEYQLQSLVVEVGTEGSPPHLVSLVRSPDAASSSSGGAWLLFNDFLVKEMTEDEALSFVGDWKTPAIVFYQEVESITIAPSPVVEERDTDILHRDACVSARDASKIRHRILKEDEVPNPGTLISIDAEFVALQMEELEIRSDGTKQVLRPSKMSLARVSVLRGDGPNEGEPFIDDYIHTSESIANYLTEFSGIKEGDLNPQVSPYTVVPLKVAYKKLRLLVDLGCVFVGHGLSKDFRTINIFVPPKQVIDTVNIYYDPARHRKLSLRFLSWFLLKQEIQTAEHDSIEDARSALLLYRMYESFVADNRFEDVMEDIFEAGKRLGFKPPLPAAASEQTIQVQADQPNVTKVTNTSAPPRERHERRGRGYPSRNGR